MSDKDENTDPLKPLNLKEKPKNPVAIAVEDGGIDEGGKNKIPTVIASGRGKIAEQILRLAFDNDVKVREDAPLAEMLAAVDLDSPIPTEAFMAVAEILSYVYRANGEPDPYNAILNPIEDAGETRAC